MSESRSPDLTHVCFAGAARPRAPRRRPMFHGAAVVNHASEPAGGLAAWLLEAGGLDPRHYRSHPLGRRLLPCLRALKVSSDQDARRVVLERPDQLHRALSTLLLGVTAFFRDREVFEHLDTMVVSRLAATGRPLRILSAGCANGAELYSVAMLLDRAGALDRTTCVGVDCRRDALRDALVALYPETDLGGVAAELRARYFVPVSDGVWQPLERLQRRMAWQQADIITDAPAGPWDLVLCRNVAIYLDPGAAAGMFAGLIGQIAPGGWLVVGRAERPSPSVSLTKTGKGVYQTHA